MTTIGIDTHKDTLAACAVDGLGAPCEERSFSNDPTGHRSLAAWVGTLEPERIGLEGSSSYGAAAARFLVASGFAVREVPPHLSRAERIRTRRPGKSDAGDALSIARVAAREVDLPPVRLADRAEEIGLLLNAREDLVHEATRVRNRLHADLVVIVPGYGGAVANLVAARHRRTIGRRLRGLSGVRAELARERLNRLGRLAVETKRFELRITALVAGHPLLGLAGVGALTAAKLIAEVGDVRSRIRFVHPVRCADVRGREPRKRCTRCGACRYPMPRWCRTRGSSPTCSAGSTTTRSIRSGSLGSRAPAIVPRSSSAKAAARSRARFRKSTVSSGRPKSRPARQRTSTTASAGGGPGSTATRSSSSRPIRTFRPSTRHPSASSRRATSSSAASPSD